MSYIPSIGLDIYIEEDHYTVYEGQTQNPVIQLRFGRTQNSFTMTLFPVSITEAIDPTGFNVGAFIASDNDAEATPGKWAHPYECDYQQHIHVV